MIFFLCLIPHIVFRICKSLCDEIYSICVVSDINFSGYHMSDWELELYHLDKAQLGVYF